MLNRHIALRHYAAAFVVLRQGAKDNERMNGVRRFIFHILRHVFDGFPFPEHPHRGVVLARRAAAGGGVDLERLDGLKAQVLLPGALPTRPGDPGHMCRQLHPGTVRNLRYI